LGCNCKKKNQVSPTQHPAKIVLTENDGNRSPEPIQTPKQNADDIIKKLNEILSNK
jgi:hypothetical protein